MLDAAPSFHTELDTIRLHYKVLGEGDASVVLVHGGGCDLTFWEAQLAPLAAVARVVLLDLPGHGQSDKPHVDYTMKLFARAVHAVMDASRTRDAVLVGHSMGVPILREFQRSWPERTRGLVAIDGILYYEPLGFSRRAVLALLRTPLFGPIWNTFVNALTNEHTPEDLRQKVDASMKGAPRHVTRCLLGAMAAPDTAMNDPVKVPTLALYAPGLIWPRDLEEKVASLVPDLRFHRIEGASHFVHAERPHVVNPLILEFLASLTRG